MMIFCTIKLIRNLDILVLGVALMSLLIMCTVLGIPHHQDFIAIGSVTIFGYQWPQFYRFKLGKFEVTTFLDGAIQSEDTHPRYGINQPADKVLSYAESRGLPCAWYENGFVPVVVNTGSDLVLFDTGNGKSHRNKRIGHLGGLLKEAGYHPEDIDVVALTHGHPDHILGLLDNGEPAYPNARYAIGEIEFEFWNKGVGIPSFRKENRELFVKIVGPLADRSTFVKEGSQIAPGIHTVEAFGHSAGHLAFSVESEGRRMMILGDTTNHYILSLQQPDWHFNRDDNKELAAITRRKILEMVSTEQIPVIGHHLPFPSVGYVKKIAESYRWLPSSYEFNR